MTTEGCCVWLYAVAATGAGTGTGCTGSVTGVDGDPVRTVRMAGLTAFIGDVDQREFGAAALRRNLEDLDWLDRTARAHHAVIEAIAERYLVVPMRLATVYTSDEGVAEALRQRATDLREALSWIRARSEWGVKAFAAEPASQAMAAEGPPAGHAATGPGAAYLQRRRAHLMTRESGRQEAMAGAQAVHAELCRLAASSRLHPAQSPELAGQPARMVLNAAYLVADARAEEFGAAIADLTERHRSVRLAVTGPWPAYSFVGQSSAEARQ